MAVEPNSPQQGPQPGPWQGQQHYPHPASMYHQQAHPQQPVYQQPVYYQPVHPQQTTYKVRKDTSHTFHLLMTVFTCGVWGVLVWVPITIWHAFGARKKITERHQ
jgi:hypothetical protein